MTLNSMGGDFEGNVDKVDKDRYFIIDMIGINPTRPGNLQPRIVVSNATKADMDKIKAGEVKIPDPMIGAKQRITVKVSSVRDLGIKEVPKG